MPIRPPKDPTELTNKATLDRWCRATPISPSHNSVGAEELKNGAVLNEKLRDSAGNSVIGRSGAVGGDPADIALPEGTFLGTRGSITGAYSLLDADIPGSIARDSEVAAAVSAHEAAPDPHPQYATDVALTTALTGYASIETTGTYTGAYTGTTTDPAPVIRWSKVGKLVAIYLGQSSATSNTAAFTITGAPAAIRPARAQSMVCILRDNDTPAFGRATMGTDGTLTFGLGAASGTFTASGAKGAELQTLTYSLD